MDQGTGDNPPLSDIAIASSKVAAIVEAAERAAEEMRLEAESRSRDRIAEAARAADIRVDAAEAEARELLEEAREQADGLQAQAKAAVAHIHERAAQTRFDAERRREATAAEARETAERVKAEAEAYAADITRSAKGDARDIIGEAHGVSGEVMREGTELAGHLHELSDSLRRNAERLLRDVHLAHARLTADLDQATPAGPYEPVVRASKGPAAERDAEAAGHRRDRGEPPEPPDGDFDVPEFLPRRR